MTKMTIAFLFLSSLSTFWFWFWSTIIVITIMIKDDKDDNRLPFFIFSFHILICPQRKPTFIPNKWLRRYCHSFSQLDALVCPGNVYEILQNLALRENKWASLLLLTAGPRGLSQRSNNFMKSYSRRKYRNYCECCALSLFFNRSNKRLFSTMYITQVVSEWYKGHLGSC